MPGAMEHRKTCHRCGNLRKNLFFCVACPMSFCARCQEKFQEEFGGGCFSTDCPVCSLQCCCADKLISPQPLCTRQNVS
jgi:hypothetical protein